MTIDGPAGGGEDPAARDFLDKVIKITEDTWGLAEGVEFGPETTLSGLDADSMDLAELVLRLEEEFDIDFTPDDDFETPDKWSELSRYLIDRWRQQGDGGDGVREPRNPILPTDSGTMGLDTPRG